MYILPYTGADVFYCDCANQIEKDQFDLSIQFQSPNHYYRVCEPLFCVFK